MRTLTAAIVFASVASVSAQADVAVVKGTFVGAGTYATDEGCKKLAALAAGGDKNVGTVPETLTEDGFEGWEGSCTFTSFTEIEKGKKWKVLMHCTDGPDEGPESDIFERLPDGKLKVTVMDNATIFQRCDTDKGN
ncbi:MAG: hypothetical protein WBP38_03325 [Hyphomicrobium sp.]|nr:hypothetical protein [Hyphomicrobium sp.]